MICTQGEFPLPLRVVCDSGPERIADDEVTPMNSEKYGTITSSKKDFPADEPLFVLRGQDKLAASAVLAYCRALYNAGLREEAHAVDKIWQTMANYSPKKMPD